MSDSRIARAWIEFGVWMVIAGFFFVFSFEFSTRQAGTFEWGPAFWPRLMVGIMVVAALAHLLETLAKLRREARNGDGGADSAPRFVWFEGRAWQTIGIFAVPIIYVALLPGAGFYVLTPFFLVAELLLLGERSVPRIAIVTTLIYGVICFVFAALFYVALPVGNWPGFYDFNTWIVEQLR